MAGPSVYSARRIASRQAAVFRVDLLYRAAQADRPARQPEGSTTCFLGTGQSGLQEDRPLHWQLASEVGEDQGARRRAN